jgi:AcrR family transcriptional regulator
MKASATTTPTAGSSSTRTRERLILAGERLFAEHGIDGVSLRQINVEAGQRNSSAAHYHFGSKLSLIHAVSDYRMERVNRRRMQMLDTLAGSGRDRDVRAIVETIVQPIAEEIAGSEGGSYYIRFLAQMIGHPQLKLEDIWASRFATGMKRVTTLLHRALPDIPPAIFLQRFGLMWEQIIHALADRERLSSTAANDDRQSVMLFVSNLVDVIAGGLTAPVSPGTKQYLGATQSPRHVRA